MLKLIDVTTTRNVYIDSLLSIDVLHHAYHKLAYDLSQKSNCALYLVDATLSERLHYMTPHRSKMKSFFKILLKGDYYFSIKYINKKEVFYTTKKFSLKNIDYTSISTLKVYVRVYSKTTGFMIFASRVALVIDFWREELDMYRSNVYSEVATMMAASKLKESIGFITINKLKIPCLKAYIAIHDYTLNNPVDIVYTWVDDTDKKWLRKKDKRLRQYQSYISPTATDKTRFQNNNELLYSLRSILTYLKGINNIYIVTDNQTPSFLIPKNKKIKIIDHKDIFKYSSHLPSFSSMAIESQLHRIRGLSKRYLYFNDDVFIGRANTMSLFFDTYGHAKCFYSNYTAIPPTQNDTTYSPVDNAAINNRNILKEKYGISVFKKFQHTPVPVLRKVIKSMEKEFPNIFELTASHPIRSNDTYSLTGAFYYHYGLIKGVIHPATLRYSYILLGSDGFSIKIKHILAKKESKRFDVICVNSETMTNSYKEDVKLFQHLFSRYYPCSAEWEKQRRKKKAKALKKRIN